MKLSEIYNHVNKSLKGSFVTNEEVEIQARVTLPDGTRHTLKFVKVETEVRDIPLNERVKMQGMYPPEKRAQISIECELNK